MEEPGNESIDLQPVEDEYRLAMVAYNWRLWSLWIEYAYVK